MHLLNQQVCDRGHMLEEISRMCLARGVGKRRFCGHPPGESGIQNEKHPLRPLTRRVRDPCWETPSHKQPLRDRLAALLFASCSRPRGSQIMAKIAMPRGTGFQPVRGLQAGPCLFARASRGWLRGGLGTPGEALSSPMTLASIIGIIGRRVDTVDGLRYSEPWRRLRQFNV